MKRFGHSSARAALIYQHASRERDEAIAKGFDELTRGSLDPENAPDVARMWHANMPAPSGDQMATKEMSPDLGTSKRAGDGNRTRVLSLGS